MIFSGVIEANKFAESAAFDSDMDIVSFYLVNEEATTITAEVFITREDGVPVRIIPKGLQIESGKYYKDVGLMAEKSSKIKVNTTGNLSFYFSIK